jgi:hypothetical protein
MEPGDHTTCTTLGIVVKETGVTANEARPFRERGVARFDDCHSDHKMAVWPVYASPMVRHKGAPDLGPT